MNRYLTFLYDLNGDDLRVLIKYIIYGEKCIIVIYFRVQCMTHIINNDILLTKHDIRVRARRLNINQPSNN